jgi:hypothetical protein
MNYLKVWFESHSVFMEILLWHQMHTNVRDALIYAKCKRTVKSFMFRFETEEKLNALCRLLGKYVETMAT